MIEDIHWRKYSNRFKTYPKLIHEDIDPNVRMIICIPVFHEPHLLNTLNSLVHCEFSGFKTEVILLFNTNSTMSREDVASQKLSWIECLDWINLQDQTHIRFFPVYTDLLPDPQGGVGWARKIAMDEAARRLVTDGIILCLDADCSVSTNYIQEIYQHFQDHKTCDAVSIFVEHKIDDLVPSHKEAIVQYELHLRYLIHAQRWCGHPFAFHTIGSAMAVRRKAYMNQGGMNTRRAGEDFYFLQKFIEVGSHMDLNGATVYPSARISERVPFGTGKAMKQILEDGEQWLTTDFEIFASIRPLFQSLDRLRTILLHKINRDDSSNILRELELSDDVIFYLQQTEFLDECRSIAGHTASIAAFKKRFFRFFNAFRMIKFMHYMSDHHFPDIPVLQAVVKLKAAMKWSIPMHEADELGYLRILRSIDRENR